MKIHRLLTLLALSSFSLHPSSFCRAQGSLTPPPGAPAPTMKTLDQIEPRTPVNTATTPGDANSLYIISQPGSYFITGNITGVSGKFGIKVMARGVTLDLGGFEMAGVAGSLSGIVAGADIDRFSLKNGTLRGWGGTGCKAGSSLSFGSFDRLILSENGSSGLEAGFNSRVTNCIASGNGYHGILAYSGGVITGCSAYSNKGSGISTGSGSTVRDCVASGTNPTAGSANGSGIHAGSGSVITHCVANSNADDGIFVYESSIVKDCSATYNEANGIQFFTSGGVGHQRAENCVSNYNGTAGTGSGILGAPRCTILNCTASNNSGDGINATSDSSVTGCIANANGTGGAAAGIRITGSGSRAEGNSTRDNIGTGILATAGDLIIRNNSGGNSTANYTPNSGNNFAPLQLPATQTNPNANF